MTDKEIILSLINENKLLKEEKEELLNEKEEKIKKERIRNGKIIEILNRMNGYLNNKTC